MLYLPTVINTLVVQAPRLQQKYPVQLLGVFGSVARSDNTSDSDLDLLVAFDETMSLNHLLDLTDELEQLFGTKIDLVTQQQINPRYWTYIQPEIVYLPTKK